MGGVPQAWMAFFATSAGAAATLAGLLVVAVSVNLQRILAHLHLPARAAAAVGALLVVLLIGIAALIPQSISSYAIEALAFGGAGWLLQIWAAAIMAGAPLPTRPHAPQLAANFLLGQAHGLPLLAGSVLLLLGREAGLSWLAGGVLATFVVAMLTGWVLLIEILR
jgi:hypothetical protein